MQAELKELRILHTASQFLFYLMTFRTEDFQRTMCDSGIQSKEELLQVLCDVLVEKGEDYNALTDYLEDEANGSYSLFGIRSTEFIQRTVCSEPCH